MRRTEGGLTKLITTHRPPTLTLTLTYTTTSISTPSTPSPTHSPTLLHIPPSPLLTSTIPLGPFTKNVPTLVSSLEKASQHSDTARPARTARRYTEQGQVGSSPGLLSSRRRCGCKQLESASICWSPAASACSQASTVPSSQPSYSHTHTHIHYYVHIHTFYSLFDTLSHSTSHSTITTSDVYHITRSFY